MNSRASRIGPPQASVVVTAQQFNTSRLMQIAGPAVERRFIGWLTTRF